MGSVLAVSAHSAPQLLYNGYAGLAGLPYHHTAVHAVPTVAKKTLTYKTAAFEPVEADPPADAKLISLKETEHSYDVLVPGPVKYVTSPVAYAITLTAMLDSPTTASLSLLPLLLRRKLLR